MAKLLGARGQVTLKLGWRGGQRPEHVGRVLLYIEINATKQTGTERTQREMNWRDGGGRRGRS